MREYGEWVREYREKYVSVTVELVVLYTFWACKSSGVTWGQLFFVLSVEVRFKLV